MGNAQDADLPELQDAQVKSPHGACGRAVGFLMTAPELAKLSFGHVAGLIAGQVNRGDYFFVLDRDEKLVGYCGWVCITHAQADAWLNENRDTIDPDNTGGPVCAISLWKASGPRANAAMVDAMRRRLPQTTEMVVARRIYRDGRIRPVRLAISPEQFNR